MLKRFMIFFLLLLFSALPAAAEKSRVVGSETDVIAAPDIMLAETSMQGMELIWAAKPETSSTFLIEALRVPSSEADYSNPVTAQTTTGSGYLDTTANSAGDMLWRVSNLSDSNLDYAPSQWVAPQDVTAPKGRVTFVVDPEVEGMAQTAGVFADQLRGAGYWVRVDNEAPEEISDFYISFGYASDEMFASEVAQYLPFSREVTPMKQVAGAAYPEEIFVNLTVLR